MKETKTPERPERSSIIVRIDSETRKKLLRVSAKQNRTINKQIEHYINKGLEKEV
jgi:predicted HicB family RNase H-like nuclease